MIKIKPVHFSKPIIPEDAKDSSLEKRMVREIEENKIEIEEKDILVITSKIVSLLEGNAVKISSIKPRLRIKILSKLFSIDAYRLELIFREGKVLGTVPLRRILNDKYIWNFYLKHSKNIDATKEMLKKNFINVPMTSNFGLMFDNAGIDGSNLPEGFLAPLPKNPCFSAKK
ncbi:MAG: coenzyme F420-0:L-glutamate ligase, partial [Kosmotogaceae bacterium]